MQKTKLLFTLVLVVFAALPLTLQAQEQPTADEPPRELSVILEAAQIQHGLTVTPAQLRAWYLNPFTNLMISCEREDYVANQIENQTGSYHLPESFQECVASRAGYSLSSPDILWWLEERSSLRGDGAMSLVRPFMTREPLAQKLVDYAVPFVRAAVAQMSVERRTALRETLVQLKTYAENLQGAELVAERNYANGPLSYQFLDCPRDTAERLGRECWRDATAGGQRRAQAFIYRRISGGLSRQFVASVFQTFIDLLQ